MTARLGPWSRKPLSLAVLVIGGMAALAGPVAAQQPQQREHVVRRGDTLWDIARAYLSNPFLWPLIYEANRQVVENPHWIYPAERLVIPPVVPAVTAVRTDSGARPRSLAQGIAEQQRETGRTRFYKEAEVSEQDTTRRVIVAEEQVPYAVSPYEFHGTPFLADSSELTVIGRLVRSGDPARGDDRLPPQLLPMDRVYVGRLERTPTVGDTVVAVRIGRNLRSAGRVIEPVALLRVDEVGTGIATTTVVRQFAETRMGDLVVPMEMAPSAVRGRAQDLAGGAEGRIIGFQTIEPLYAVTDRAFIDIGQAQGIALGDELIAYLPERPLRARSDELLPPLVVATLRVVRVRGDHATVRVVGVENGALSDGLSVRVVRRVQ